MNMPAQHFHVLVFFLLGVLLAVGPLIASFFLRERGSRKDRTPYECGMDAVGTPWVSPNIRFYLFALVFVVFDVEAVFVFPWAVDFRELGAAAFAAVLSFVGILLVGLAYAWRKGALKWE
jgi:NADH:ubiquinone oxidoreductase subunit 3 (subunit A)